MLRKRQYSIDEDESMLPKYHRLQEPRQDMVRKHDDISNNDEYKGTNQRRRLNNSNGTSPTTQQRFSQLSLQNENQRPVEEIHDTVITTNRHELQQQNETFDFYQYQNEFNNSMIALAYIWLSQPETSFEYVHYNAKVRQLYYVVDPPTSEESKTFTAALYTSDISEHQLQLHERGRHGYQPASLASIAGARRFMYSESQHLWHLEGMITGYINFESFIHMWFQRLRAEQDLQFHRQWEGSQQIESTPLFEGRIEHVATEWRSQKPKIEVECFNCQQQIVQFFPIIGLTTMLFGPGFVSVASDRWLTDFESKRKYRYIITPYTIYNWYKKYNALTYN
jgi:hypothetical protein